MGVWKLSRHIPNLTTGKATNPSAANTAHMLVPVILAIYMVGYTTDYNIRREARFNSALCTCAARTAQAGANKVIGSMTLLRARQIVDWAGYSYC